MATKRPAFPHTTGFTMHAPKYRRTLAALIATGGEDGYTADTEEWFPKMVFMIECRSAATLVLGGDDDDAVLGAEPFDAKEVRVGRYTRLDHSASTIADEADIILHFQD